jgi:hypothetical protein
MGGDIIAIIIVTLLAISILVSKNLFPSGCSDVKIYPL